jgi:YgiT-type zinc finger domain-containing protein
MVKPKNSMHNHQCVTCGKGRIQLRKINERYNTPKIVIKDIWVEVCEKCGEKLYGPDTCVEIERQIKKKYPDFYKRRK